MRNNDELELRVVRSFLQGNGNYMGLALALEEAVESLRTEAAKELKAALTRRIGTLQAHRRKAWNVATPGRGAASSVFRRGLYTKKEDWTAEVWINHWSRHRLDIEISVGTWPADASGVRSQILKTLREFAQGQEDATVWTEDERNSGDAKRVRYMFHGDEVLLSGDLKKNVRKQAEGIEQLMNQLMDNLDSA